MIIFANLVLSSFTRSQGSALCFHSKQHASSTTNEVIIVMVCIIFPSEVAPPKLDGGLIGWLGIFDVSVLVGLAVGVVVTTLCIDGAGEGFKVSVGLAVGVAVTTLCIDGAGEGLFIIVGLAVGVVVTTLCIDGVGECFKVSVGLAVGVAVTTLCIDGLGEDFLGLSDGFFVLITPDGFFVLVGVFVLDGSLELLNPDGVAVLETLPVMKNVSESLSSFINLLSEEKFLLYRFSSADISNVFFIMGELETSDIPARQRKKRIM